MTNSLKNSISNAMKVFKLPLGDLFARQTNVLDQLIVSPLSSLGIALGVGKNFSCTSHVDGDMTFTFSGSFSTKPGKVGNGFIFPTFRLKAEFPDDINHVRLFAFNPRFEVKRFYFPNLYVIYVICF